MHSQIVDAGASLFAISPQLPERSRTLIEKRRYPFEILRDPGNEVGASFGLRFTLPEDLKTYLSIACIFPLKPEILLIDEPTTGLDPVTSAVIGELILSGGDPLSVPDGRLSALAKQLSGIGHLHTLRIHTRLPVVLPERVDQLLLDWLTDLPQRVVMVVHCNHPNELDATVETAMRPLQQAGVDYRVDEASGMMLVPSAKLKEIRMQLAGQGLPNSVGMGFEILQQDTGFGTSQLVEKARHQQALQGELARTIATIGAVQSARVHLAIPKQSVFVRKRQPPSASVAVRLHNGRALEDGQVEAIVHLVASSVPELETGRIQMLFAAAGGDGGGIETVRLVLRQPIGQLALQHVQVLLHGAERRLELVGDDRGEVLPEDLLLAPQGDRLQQQPALLQAPGGDQTELIGGERLGEEVVGTTFHGVHGRGDGGMGRDHDNLCIDTSPR